eukprot:scaffold39320_cov25-Tisochrysis_lutea.AAC.1
MSSASPTAGACPVPVRRGAREEREMIPPSSGTWRQMHKVCHVTKFVHVHRLIRIVSKVNWTLSVVRVMSSFLQRLKKAANGAQLYGRIVNRNRITIVSRGDHLILMRANYANRSASSTTLSMQMTYSLIGNLVCKTGAAFFRSDLHVELKVLNLSRSPEWKEREEMAFRRFWSVRATVPCACTADVALKKFWSEE